MNDERIEEIKTRLNEINDELVSNRERIALLESTRREFSEELNRIEIEDTGLEIGMKLSMNVAFFADRARYIEPDSEFHVGSVVKIFYYYRSDNTFHVKLDDILSIGGVPMNIIRSMRADYLAAHPELIGGQE